MTNPTIPAADVEHVAKAIASRQNTTFREEAHAALAAALSLGYRRDGAGLSASARSLIMMLLDAEYNSAADDASYMELHSAADACRYMAEVDEVRREINALEGKVDAVKPESKETT